MRFAYIDSQGNTVEIPSEDALRLRIELGAIVDDTSLRDGEDGRWAPAREHEVFRRLRANVGRRDAGSPSVEESGPATSPVPTRGQDRPAEPRSVSLPPGATPPPPAPADDAGEVFDFGDFGALDLEEAATPEPRSTAPPPESPRVVDAPPTPSGGDPWTVQGRGAWPPEGDDGIGPGVSPMEGVAFGDEPAPPGPRPGLHPFDAEEEVPAWLRDDPEFGEGGARTSPDPDPTREQVRERRDVAAGAAGGGSRAAPSARAAHRPGPPRTGRTAPWGRIAGITGLVAVVAGGAWWVMGRGASARAADDPEVVLPAIAPTLEPVVRQAGAAALAATVDSLAALPARSALAEEMNPEWLGGHYMANASRYDDVRLYWESMGRYVQIMRAREDEVFAGALAAALDTVALPDDDRAAVTERTLAGFEAAAPDRAAVYAQLTAVADAALSLQVFLEQNEPNIDHEPAVAGLSRDPVLEAVPLTEALGREMWDRVADITSALDALGFLDRVTTDRLLSVFFAKLGSVPVL